MREDIRALVEHVVGGFSPHMAEMGVEVVSAEPGRLTFRLDLRPEFVGDPGTGVPHGGVVTVLLDSVSGLAAMSALREPAPIATLDLRIDYLRAATPGLALLAEAHCYRVTRAVAFTRGFAYQEDPDDPVAHAAGSFIISGPGASFAALKGGRGA